MRLFLSWVKRDDLFSIIKQTGIFTINCYKGWRCFAGRWESVKKTAVNVKFFMGF